MVLRKIIETGQINGVHRNIASETCLFAHGDSNHTLYYLIIGSGRLTLQGGAQRIIPGGNLLGLHDLVHDTYSHAFVTSEPSEVLCIAKEDLQKTLQVNAALRLYLIQQLSKQTLLTKTAYE